MKGVARAWKSRSRSIIEDSLYLYPVMSSHFDEKSGVVKCPTSWGAWWQTIDEVYIEVNVTQGTRAKDVNCKITPHAISLTVSNKDIIKGELQGGVVSDECVWTLEDRKTVQIVLVKSEREAKNCWKSLLVGEYNSDPYLSDQMEKKMTLERFSRENPGMDFSGAEITGNYHGGGPQFT